MRSISVSGLVYLRYRDSEPLHICKLLLGKVRYLLGHREFDGFVARIYNNIAIANGARPRVKMLGRDRQRGEPRPSAIFNIFSYIFQLSIFKIILYDIPYFVFR